MFWVLAEASKTVKTYHLFMECFVMFTYSLIRVIPSIRPSSITTCPVLSCGVDQIYPDINQDIIKLILIWTFSDYLGEVLVWLLRCVKILSTDKLRGIFNEKGVLFTFLNLRYWKRWRLSLINTDKSDGWYDWLILACHKYISVGVDVWGKRRVLLLVLLYRLAKIYVLPYCLWQLSLLYLGVY